jgi:hypothetical protein
MNNSSSGYKVESKVRSTQTSRMTVGDVQLTHLPADTPVEKVIEVIERDGGVIVDKFYSLDLIKQMMEETQPYFGGTETFDGTLSAFQTNLRQTMAERDQSLARITRQVHWFPPTMSQSTLACAQ